MIETLFVVTFWFLSGLSFLMVSTGLVGIWRYYSERANHDPR